MDDGHRQATASVVSRARQTAIRLSEWGQRKVARFPEYREDLPAAMGPPYDRVRQFTMTSAERMFALSEAVKYVVHAGIPGDVVECGVWRGGSAMLCAYGLLDAGDTTRHLYLYDTYSGMPMPTARDRDFRGVLAMRRWSTQATDHGSDWCYASLDEVRENLAGTGYPQDHVHLVEGRVQDTLPGTAPERISLLRLDTDWYDSTLHELEHLFPRLSVGGVLIIDDYGHWQGVRDAVDEYLQKNQVDILLNRLDYSGRLGVKTKD